MGFRLIVGLGNPGLSYEATRHNIGFRVLDSLARQEGISFQEESKGPVELARWGDVRLIKPMTFMNLSGRAVRTWIEWLKLSARDVLVVVDDVYLPLGQLRLRSEGSDGGHNGLKSIEMELGSGEFARVRCGVGPIPERMALEDFVLGRFRSEEQKTVDEMVKQAVGLIGCCQEQGIGVAMNRFNRKVQD